MLFEFGQLPGGREDPVGGHGVMDEEVWIYEERGVKSRTLGLDGINWSGLSQFEARGVSYSSAPVVAMSLGSDQTKSAPPRAGN